MLTLRSLPQNPLLISCLLVASLILGGCSTDPYIHDFAYEGDTATVAAMLDDGWHPDRANEIGKTGLMIAAERDDIAMAKVFIQKGANPNARTSGGWTPLYFAADAGASPEMIELLLDSGASVDMEVGSKGWSPLLIAAYKGHADTLRSLLDGGAAINQKTNYGLTPLMWAVNKDHNITARILIHRGADFSPRDRDGDDVFSLAKGKKYTTVSFLKQEQERYQAKLAVREKREAEERVASRLAEARERDKALTPEIRRDKYLVALSTALKQEAYADALIYAQLLEDNALAVDDSLYYFWGEALYEEGQPEQAIAKLNVYLNKAGSAGKYYTQALQLLLKAEEVL